MKIFIDTNLWARFFIQDIQDQYEATKNLLALVEEGRFKIYTSTVVLLELQYVLQKLYKLSFKEMIEVFKAIKRIRGITIIERTNFDLALQFYKKYKIKFTDCLIASQLPQNTVLISFDEELSKIKDIDVNKPQEIKL